VSFTVTLKDSHGSKIPHGGTVVKAKVSPGPGVGGSDLDGIVKDLNDGSYTVTYLVPKRGNYNVNVSVDDRPIMGSPFPVFFSTGSTTTTTTLTSTTTLGTIGTIGTIGTTPVPMYGMMNQTMPNMPNYMVGTGLGMMATGNSGGVILQGVGASLGEVCKEYLYGKCAKAPGECRFGHPPQQLLMHVLATAATTMNGTLMGPSAAAMAAAQAIVAAQALQAHAAQMKSQKPEGRDAAGSGSLMFLPFSVFLFLFSVI
jgi:Filamin/ABP280 repeat